MRLLLFFLQIGKQVMLVWKFLLALILLQSFLKQIVIVQLTYVDIQQIIFQDLYCDLATNQDNC